MQGIHHRRQGLTRTEARLGSRNPKNGGLMGLYGGLMGFYGGLMRFYGGLMGEKVENRTIHR